ncbi:transposase [Lachnospiraceae bacterium ZAX-1]
MEYEKFSEQANDVFKGPKQIYDAVKIQRALNQKGIPCSLKRVQRHMPEQGLRSVAVKKYNHATSQGAVPDGKKIS